MESDLYGEMFAMEERHWWFLGRRRIVMDVLRRFVASGNGRRPRLLDLGCGCGANLRAYTRGYDAWGMDASPAAARFARSRAGARVCLGALPDQVPFARGAFDAVVMTDVLEHLDDDRATVATVVGLLRPGGVLVATVPAGQWLYAPRDAAHHHRRRYHKRQMADLFGGLPARLELLSYYNTFLFPPAVVGRLVSRLIRQRGTADLALPSAPVNAVLRALFSAERFLLAAGSLPVGLSLIAVARRT